MNQTCCYHYVPCTDELSNVVEGVTVYFTEQACIDAYTPYEPKCETCKFALFPSALVAYEIINGVPTTYYRCLNCFNITVVEEEE